MFEFSQRHLLQKGSLSTIIQLLDEAGLLTEAVFHQVVAHKKHFQLEHAIRILKSSHLLNHDTFMDILRHETPLDMSSAIIELNKAELLTPEFRAKVASCGNRAPLVASAFAVLKACHLLTPENISRIMIYPNLHYIYRPFSHLAKAGLATQETLDAILAHRAPDLLDTALYILSDNNLLTEDNFMSVYRHRSPNQLGYVLVLIAANTPLLQRHIDLLARYTHPEYIGQVMNQLEECGLLTVDNIMALIHPAHSLLVSEESLGRVWGRLPRHYLTQRNLDRLFAATTHPEPERRLEDVTNTILANPFQVEPIREIHPVAEPVERINPQQSTHTASVHRSVSLSARRLMESYGERLNIDKQIEALNAFVLSLDDSLKNAAAKRCVARLTGPLYTFTDSSGISTLQLLGLVFMAIHDEAKRKDHTGASVSLDDAKAMLVEGLYEIQRGYNLDQHAVDLGSREDRPICSAGTFNKLIEKLNGIHMDVEIRYITHAGACAKFPIVAAEQALRYLMNLSSPVTMDELMHINALIHKIKEEGSLEPIWPAIVEGVKSTLWEEYNEAYSDWSEHPLFMELLGQGVYLEAPDLTSVEMQLSRSFGYQALKRLDGEHCHRLWSNRHVSVESQAAFDREYGLIRRP